MAENGNRINKPVEELTIDAFLAGDNGESTDSRRSRRE